jgi:hypothetical protein
MLIQQRDPRLNTYYNDYLPHCVMSVNAQIDLVAGTLKVSAGSKKGG